MALTSCPECGHPISVKALKCPSCGHCMQTNSESTSPSDTSSTPLATDTLSVVPSTTESHFQMSFLNKKSFFLGFIVLLLLFAIFIGHSLFFNHITVKEITISKWTLTDSTSSSDYYEGRITSTQKSPFIAVIGNYTSETSAPSFVYVEDGVGVFETSVSDDDDPSLIYRPVGYLSGKSISENDIKTSYSDYDYHDWSYSKSSTCMVDLKIRLKGNQSGILIFDIINESNNETVKNCTAVVIDGSTTYSYYAELPYKTRGAEIKVVPKSFCKCRSISEKDYTITSPYEVEYDKGTYSQSYFGTMSLHFDNISDGFVLYSRKLTNGGESLNRNTTQNRCALLNNGDCTLTTYDSADSDQTLLAPTYEYDFIGHLYWTLL